MSPRCAVAPEESATVAFKVAQNVLLELIETAPQRLGARATCRRRDGLRAQPRRSGAHEARGARGGSLGHGACHQLRARSTKSACGCAIASRPRNIDRSRRNARYLPGFPIPAELRVSSDPELCLRDCEVAICAVPTHGVARGARHLRPTRYRVDPRLQGFRARLLLAAARGSLQRARTAAALCLVGPQLRARSG